MNNLSDRTVFLPPAPSVLIILMGSLGDVTRGLSLLVPIKQHYPDATITWLVEPPCFELVAEHPLIDEVIVFDRPNWRRGGLKQIIHRLRTGRFDCVLDLQRHFKSGLFSFLSRAPHRIGFHRKNAKEGNWLLNTDYICEKDPYYPKIKHYQVFLEPLGVSPAFPLDFGFSKERLQKIAAPKLAGVKQPFVAIVLGSSWPSKEWFYDRYRELIKDIVKTTDLAIVLLDAPAKRPLAEKLTRETGTLRLTNRVGETSVPEVLAILNEAAVAVGPDCGAGHLAAAVKTPYVALFGPTDGQRTAPYGCEHLVVKKSLPCAPCYKRRCPRKDLLCMRSIEVSDVREKLLQALKE